MDNILHVLLNIFTTNGGDMHDLTINELIYQIRSVVEFDDPHYLDVLIDYVVDSWGNLDELGDLILIGTPGCGWDKVCGLLRLWCHPGVIVLEIPQRNTALAPGAPEGDHLSGTGFEIHRKRAGQSPVDKICIPG
jgi:hypothetical protein